MQYLSTIVGIDILMDTIKQLYQLFVDINTFTKSDDFQQIIEFQSLIVQIFGSSNSSIANSLMCGTVTGKYYHQYLSKVNSFQILINRLIK
jgi:hypothetical protein